MIPGDGSRKITYPGSIESSRGREGEKSAAGHRHSSHSLIKERMSESVFSELPKVDCHLLSAPKVDDNLLSEVPKVKGGNPKVTDGNAKVTCGIRK